MIMTYMRTMRTTSSLKNVNSMKKSSRESSEIKITNPATRRQRDCYYQLLIMSLRMILLSFPKVAKDFATNPYKGGNVDKHSSVI